MAEEYCLGSRVDHTFGMGSSLSVKSRRWKPKNTQHLLDARVMNSVFAGSPESIQFVIGDAEGKLSLNPEAIAMLQLVKGPVGVVSVCGRPLQGKSYILNQLLGRSCGFEVAPTQRPCTKGIWIWSAPLKMTALDGTEYNLLLLDTEGIDVYDQTGTYSTQIFSLAVLLSTMFIYNQMGGIDGAALDWLSLVTEMIKHIRVRASGGKSTASELGQFPPIFCLATQGNDFYLDLVEDNRRITPREYLELALRPVQGGGKDVAAKNKIRESIRALFPDRECFTLVRPLSNEKDLQQLHQIPLNKLRPEFKAGLDALTSFVFERTKPKQIGGTIVTGPLLVRITQSYLDALNSGAVPTITSSWQAAFREARKAATQSFNSVAVGAGSTMQKYEKRLQTFLNKSFEAKCCSFEEKCPSMSRTSETAQQESVERTRKYKLHTSKVKPEEDQSTLHESRTAAKVRLAAARAKLDTAAREGAKKIKQRVGIAVRKSKVALKKGASILQQSSKQRQFREDALRAQVENMELRVLTLEEREKEIESLLKSSNEERADTLHVMEDLLENERAARAQASSRAEALYVQLQDTQNKLDQAHQQLIAMWPNETALDGKCRIGIKRKRVRAEG